MNFLHVALTFVVSFVTHAIFLVFLTAGTFFTPTLPQKAPQTLPAPTSGQKTSVGSPSVASSTKTLTGAPSASPRNLKNLQLVKIPSGAPVASTTKNSSIPTTAPQTVPIPKNSKTPEQVNTETRAALVNILCTTRTGGSFNPLSGSGVVIAKNGVILTNAHVAQYLLLRDYPASGDTDCLVRMGSPAVALYRASLLYLPPIWIADNASKIGTEAATSTGENDYALLLITSSVTGAPLPSAFPFVPITTDPPSPKDSAFVAAYAAQYLGGIIIQKSLFASSAYSTVGKLYGFNEKDPAADLFSLAGSVVSQEGSSGGAVVRPRDGALEGIITTEGEGATTADRELYAITLDHIDRSLAAQGQGGLIPLLSGDLGAKSADFTTQVAPGLTQQLVRVLGR